MNIVVGTVGNLPTAKTLAPQGFFGLCWQNGLTPPPKRERGKPWCSKGIGWEGEDGRAVVLLVSRGKKKKWVQSGVFTNILYKALRCNGSRCWQLANGANGFVSRGYSKKVQLDTVRLLKRAWFLS